MSLGYNLAKFGEPMLNSTGATFMRFRQFSDTCLSVESFSKTLVFVRRPRLTVVGRRTRLAMVGKRTHYWVLAHYSLKEPLI